VFFAGAESCGKLRSSDPLYIGCVKGWYTALAEQMKGLYYMDGGPITLVQVRIGTRLLCLAILTT